MTIRALTRMELRDTAKTLGTRPAASQGLCFLHDASTVRRIATACRVRRGDHVLEIGAGLGSLTLALLGKGAAVTAVESDPGLAHRLPTTVAEHCHGEVDRLTVLHRDAMTLRHDELPTPPTVLLVDLRGDLTEAALQHLLPEFTSLRTVVVLAETEYGHRLSAPPGDPKCHPSGVKLRFYGRVSHYGGVLPSAYWPVPRSHVGLLRVEVDPSHQQIDPQHRAQVFDLIDLAYAHRRNTARNAFAAWAGSGDESAKRLLTASIDPARRPDTLTVGEFLRLLDRSPHTATTTALTPQG